MSTLLDQLHYSYNNPMASVAPFTQTSSIRLEKWFEDFCHHLKSDKLMPETGTTPENTQGFYSEFPQAELVKNVIISFIENLEGKLPTNLAFDYDNENSIVFAWAEVDDDDEIEIIRLIKAEVKTNVVFRPLGFNLYITVVQKREGLHLDENYFPYNTQPVIQFRKKKFLLKDLFRFLHF